MKLLEEGEERGYPLEYLLSRIRGRRASLITDWESLVRAESRGKIAVGSADALWRRLLTEYRWVFRQMDKTVRDIFRPFFLYTELRTLFFCLRYRMTDEPVKLEQILLHSLFSIPFKKLLRRKKDILDVMDDLEEVFLPLSREFRGIRKAFLKGGLKGVEEKLTSNYLGYVIQSDLHPLIRVFFIRIIDARNLIALYKYLRWEVEGTPPFAKGGSIPETRLREVREKANIFGVISLIRTLTGLDVGTPDASGIENTLHRGMTRFLRRLGRETSGIGCILDYLWRCSMEARNLGVLFYGEESERESLLAEVVS